MVLFYDVSKFEVFSEIDKKTRRPKQTMIEFYFDSSQRVNHPQLQKILERDIKNANKFFVVVELDKIIIHIDFNKNLGLFEFDFRLSKN